MEMYEPKNTFVQRLLAGAAGGLWGGALAGLAEVAVVLLTGAAPEEYGLLWFAVLAYGVLGGTIGVLWGLLRCVVGPRHGQFAEGLALPPAVLTLVVARYHIEQRVFLERMPVFTPTGIAIHAGLLLAAVVIGLSLWRLGRRRGESWGAIGATVVAYGVLLGGCFVATRSVAVEPVVSRPTLRQKATSPNIILIIPDTLRADALGVYGASPTASPRLDEFARTAVRFSRTYAQSSWTRPSIATILTSQYPATHGAFRKADVLNDSAQTLAELLKAHGYWTAGFVSNINLAPIFNFQQGFDEYYYLPPDFYFGASDSATRLAVYRVLRVLRERLWKDRIYHDNYYEDAADVDARVMRWLDQPLPAPFFLLIHYMDPHDPYFEIPYSGYGIARVSEPNPPQARADEMRRLYGEDVTYLDTYLGNLFDRLKAKGLFENSVIAVASDHGEEFFEHGSWWHGTSLFEEQVRVPLIIKPAGAEPAGRVVDALAGNIDITPTLLAAAGADTRNATLQGHDLFAVTERTTLLGEEDFEGNRLFSWLDGDWKLIVANADNPRGLPALSLYNLASDPGEKKNLAKEESARAGAMHEAMNRHLAVVGGGAP